MLPRASAASSPVYSGKAAWVSLKKIIIIRHGSTRLNKTSGDRIRGWQDVPLDDRGIIEAHKAAKALKGLPVDFLVSSDLQRAYVTAMLISRDTSIPFKGKFMEFRPWNLGKFQSMESEAVATQIQAYVEKQPNTPVPGGESFLTFEQRLFHGIRMLCQAPGLPGLVTHYRCMCVLDAWKEAGYQPDGSIDHTAFCKKGDPPGHIKEYDIPVERLPGGI